MRNSKSMSLAWIMLRFLRSSVLVLAAATFAACASSNESSVRQGGHRPSHYEQQVLAAQLAREYKVCAAMWEMMQDDLPARRFFADVAAATERFHEYLKTLDPPERHQHAHDALIAATSQNADRAFAESEAEIDRALAAWAKALGGSRIEKLSRTCGAKNPGIPHDAPFRAPEGPPAGFPDSQK